MDFVVIPSYLGLDVPAPDGSDSLMKRKRSAQNDRSDRQKKTGQAPPDGRMTRSATKQQQLEKKERIQESCALELNGKDFLGRDERLGLVKESRGDTLDLGNGSFVCIHDFDKSNGEDQVRSALEGLFGTCGEIIYINILKNYGRACIGFGNGDTVREALELNGTKLEGCASMVEEVKLGGGSCDTLNKRKSSCALTVEEVKPGGYCRDTLNKRKGFVAERQRLVMKENRRIKKKCGFDFGEIPPIFLADSLHEPCWAEKSRNPVPKVYEEMAKIGLGSYNCKHETSYKYTKILTVYFSNHMDKSYIIFFQAEDESVASPENFLVTVFSYRRAVLVSACKKRKESWSSACHVDEFYIPGPNTVV